MYLSLYRLHCYRISLAELCIYRYVVRLYADMWQRCGMQLDVMTAWCS
jgi:hypothetical protein